MKPDTENVIRIMLTNDGTVPAAVVQEAMSLLRGEAPKIENETIRREILSRTQVATMLGVSPITVDYYGRNQIIRRVYLRGSAQAQGYSRKSVMDFIEGAQDPKKQEAAISALKVRAEKRRRTLSHMSNNQHNRVRE